MKTSRPAPGPDTHYSEVEGEGESETSSKVIKSIVEVDDLDRDSSRGGAIRKAHRRHIEAFKRFAEGHG